MRRDKKSSVERAASWSVVQLVPGVEIFPECASLSLSPSAGITQKYLLVTSNYPARKRGVTKLMGITEAQQKCPDLVLVSGEDLTPYRHVVGAPASGTRTFSACFSSNVCLCHYDMVVQQ